MRVPVDDLAGAAKAARLVEGDEPIVALRQHVPTGSGRGGPGHREAEGVPWVGSQHVVHELASDASTSGGVDDAERVQRSRRRDRRHAQKGLSPRVERHVALVAPHQVGHEGGGGGRLERTVAPLGAEARLVRVLGRTRPVAEEGHEGVRQQGAPPGRPLITADDKDVAHFVITPCCSIISKIYVTLFSKMISPLLGVCVVFAAKGGLEGAEFASVHVAQQEFAKLFKAFARYDVVMRRTAPLYDPFVPNTGPPFDMWYHFEEIDRVRHNMSVLVHKSREAWDEMLLANTHTANSRSTW